MIPTITEVDARQSLTALVELLRGRKKGGKLKGGEAEHIVRSLSDLFIKSTLGQAEIAKALPLQQVGTCFAYSTALAESWMTMTPARRGEAVQLIEGLPKREANLIRFNLVPLIAERDPRSARLILPVNDLDRPDDVKQFKDWVGLAGPLVGLLQGELAEYEIIRVLNVMLLLASEPTIAASARSSVLMIATEAITEHGLAETIAGMERIFPSLTHLLQTLPPIDADAASEKLRQRTPKVALRLGLVEPQPERGSSGGAGNPGLEIGNDEEAPISQTKIASPASNPLVPEPPRPRALREPPRAVSTENISRSGVGLVPGDVDFDVLGALEAMAREHRDSATLLETAASRLRSTADELSLAIAKVAEEQACRQKVEELIETLSAEVKTKAGELRSQANEIQRKMDDNVDLERRIVELSTLLAEAREQCATAQKLHNEQAALRQQELDSLLMRVSGQTEQKLQEYRNGLGQVITNILRGTPRPVADGQGKVDGNLILFRIWEIVDALKRKEVPVQDDHQGRP